MSDLDEILAAGGLLIDENSGDFRVAIAVNVDEADTLMQKIDLLESALTAKLHNDSRAMRDVQEFVDNTRANAMLALRRLQQPDVE